MTTWKRGREALKSMSVSPRRLLLLLIAGLVILGGIGGPRLLTAVQDVAPATAPAAIALAAADTEPEGVETLVQGPMHEAFASPAEADPTPGPVVMRRPPSEVNEEPPEYLPEGAIWVPGYWIWDDERDDFVWVTGVARQPPPGMRFVPGYWAEAASGWQRVAGFWISDTEGELTYRPEAPPETLENGPSSPAPGDNYFWIPGSWNHYDTGYRWQAGYWTPYQTDWVWCPARWVWSPAGFVYCPGYWDHLLSLRGQVFAPVYFRTALYTQPNWSFRPWCVIPTNNLFVHLWVRPTHCHYYFGDYYGPQFATWGFHPWCNSPLRLTYYDQFFNYCRVHYQRQGVDFIGRCQNWHNYYDHHVDHRPARTWHEQQHRQLSQGRGGPAREILETQIQAKRLVEVAQRNEAPVRLAKLDDPARQALVERTKKLHELNVTRKKVELGAAQVAGKAAISGKLAGKAKLSDDRDPPSILSRSQDATKSGIVGVGTKPINVAAKLPLPKPVELETGAAGGAAAKALKKGGETVTKKAPPLPTVNNNAKLATGAAAGKAKSVTKVETSARLPVDSSKLTLPKTVTPRNVLPGQTTINENTKGQVRKGTTTTDQAKLNLPKLNSAKAAASKIESAKVEKPKLGLPKIDSKKIEGLKNPLPKVETPKIEARKVELPASASTIAPAGGTAKAARVPLGLDWTTIPHFEVNRGRRPAAQTEPAQPPARTAPPLDLSRGKSALDSTRTGALEDVQRILRRFEAPRELNRSPRTETLRNTPSITIGDRASLHNTSPIAGNAEGGARYVPFGRAGGFPNQDQ